MRLFVILLPALTLITAAGVAAVNDVEGWGWFLFMVVFFIPSIGRAPEAS